MKYYGGHGITRNSGVPEQNIQADLSPSFPCPSHPSPFKGLLLKIFTLVHVEHKIRHCHAVDSAWSSPPPCALGPPCPPYCYPAGGGPLVLEVPGQLTSLPIPKTGRVCCIEKPATC